MLKHKPNVHNIVEVKFVKDEVELKFCASTKIKIFVLQNTGFTKFLFLLQQDKLT